jgi:transketolase
MNSLRDVFGRELVNLAKVDERIVAIDCDMAKHTRLSWFFNEFPERSFQAGISEQHAIGLAAGMANCGLVPIVSSSASFILPRCWEQVRHSVGLTKQNVKIIGTHVGFAGGEDGPSHQCFEDIALARAVPNLVVLAPADAFEMKEMLRFAIQYHGPVYIRMGKKELPAIFSPSYTFKLSHPIKLKNGERLALISTGENIHECLSACEQVKVENGIDVTLIHIPSIHPLDSELLLTYLEGIKYVVLVEDHLSSGGLSSLVSEKLFGRLSVKACRILSMGNQYGQTGTEDELRKHFGLDSQSIINTIRGCLNAV